MNARELHAFLGVGKDFSNWIKDRISAYGFSDGLDYAIFDSPVLANQTGRGGDRRSKEYALTLDMAKELSMVERTEKGKAARQYFIECERKLAARSAAAQTMQPALPDFTDPAAAAMACSWRWFEPSKFEKLKCEFTTALRISLAARQHRRACMFNRGRKKRARRNQSSKKTVFS